MRSTRVFLAVCATGSVALLTSVAADNQTIVKKEIPAVSAGDGAAMYQAYCSACHGAGGKGNGPAAPALKVAATDLTRLTRNNDGVFPALAVLATLRPGGGVHGSPDMPVWGDVFRHSNHDERDVYIRTYNLMKYLELIQEPAPPPAAKAPKPTQLRITDVRADFGGNMYRAYCASCHGVDGRGQGPVTPTLKGTPPDLTRLRGDDGKFPTGRIQHLLLTPEAAHGSAEMPVWGNLFRSTHEDPMVVRLRVANLTRYLEGMQH